MAPIRPQLPASHANHSATETSLCMYVCTYEHMYVLCMQVRTYECMYVCMYAYNILWQHDYIVVYIIGM